MVARVVALLAMLVAVGAVSPAAAAPPTMSGVVVRVPDATDAFAVFPDLENGYWLFINVTRSGFCQWFLDQENEPFPTSLEPHAFQFVGAGDALVWLAGGHASIFLHPFADFDPCAGSSPAAALTGAVKILVNDNDLPGDAKRGNSFGDRAQGTLTDAAGIHYHYSWNFRAVIDREDTIFKVATENYNLRPIRNGKAG